MVSLRSTANKTDPPVLLNNHTAIWGSWFSLEQGIWGFQCCHSTSTFYFAGIMNWHSRPVPVPGSYCTGEAGIHANQASTAQDLLESAASSSRPADVDRNDMSLADQHLETLRSGATGGTKGKERQRDDASSAFSKTRVGEGDDVAIDQARLKRARDDEKRRRELTDDEAWQRAKKSKTDVTEEDMGPFLVSTRNTLKLTLRRGLPTVETGLRRSDG